MRVVLDTNTVLSALLFDGGRLVWLRAAWRTNRLTPLLSRATTEELIRTLSYPKFELGPQDIESLLADYLPFGEVVTLTDAWPESLPHCRDKDDDRFLLLAAEGGAEVLVTGDRALLALAGQTVFAIESAGTFRRRFAT